MAVDDAHVFPGFPTPVLTHLFFPKPSTTFLTYFCRGERRKYARKKSCLNWGSNSQPPGHESDTLTIEPPRRATMSVGQILGKTCVGFRGHIFSPIIMKLCQNVNDISDKFENELCQVKN